MPKGLITKILIIFLAIAIWNSCSSVTQRIEGFSIHGIDVSHHQKHIEWDSVAAQNNIQFAFVKATEGFTFQDSLFCYNWSQIEKVGLLRGAYHFYRPNMSPILQAINFTSLVNLSVGDLPPVLDFEVVGNQTHANLIRDLQTWLTIVEDYYDIRPIIYTNQKMYHKYIKGHFDNYPLWIARYNTIEPEMSFQQDWTFWQYGNRGRINGIQGDVDFNVFQGNLEDLHQLTLSPKDTIQPSLSLTSSVPLL